MITVIIQLYACNTRMNILLKSYLRVSVIIVKVVRSAEMSGSGIALIYINPDYARLCILNGKPRIFRRINRGIVGIY